MNIFITGITGFVGSSLVNYFQSSGDVMVYGHSRNEASARERFKHLSVLIQSDYSSKRSDELNIDVVIHLAGIAHDLSNQFKAEDYEQVNAQNTMRVYNEFLKSKASKFIFLSSIKAAVDITDVPVDENIMPAPVTDYGKSKLKAEQYLQSNYSINGKQTYIFRPAMIHGPGNKGNLNLLYKFVKSGLPWPLGKFHNQRSFLSSENLNWVVESFMRNEIPSGIYNIADSDYASTSELVEQISMALNKKTRILNVPESWIKMAASITGQQHRINKLTENMMMSNKKLLSALGQSLPVTLQQGIKKTIESFDE